MANARLAMVEPNNYLERGVKVSELALPSWLSDVAITDKIATLVGQADVAGGTATTQALATKFDKALTAQPVNNFTFLAATTAPKWTGA